MKFVYSKNRWEGNRTIGKTNKPSITQCDKGCHRGQLSALGAQKRTPHPALGTHPRLKEVLELSG